MQHYRAEHWELVSETAKVPKGKCDQIILVIKNESIFIRLGEMHVWENMGKIPLELIEVQSSYLGEDDIVRFEDQFGRSWLVSELIGIVDIKVC